MSRRYRGDERGTRFENHCRKTILPKYFGKDYEIVNKSHIKFDKIGAYPDVEVWHKATGELYCFVDPKFRKPYPDQSLFVGSDSKLVDAYRIRALQRKVPVILFYESPWISTEYCFVIDVSVEACRVDPFDRQVKMALAKGLSYLEDGETEKLKQLLAVWESRYQHEHGSEPKHSWHTDKMEKVLIEWHLEEIEEEIEV